MTIFINLAPYMNAMEDFAELLSRWNGGIELMMDGPNWRDPVDWEEEFRRFQQYQGGISVHGPIWELNLASARYAGIREYSYEVYKECLNWCAKIGAEHMVLHPNLYSTPLFDREASQAFAKENLKRLGEYARKVNVGLAVENMGMGEYALFNQQEFTALFSEIETITALVDVGHAHVNGWDTPQLIRDLGSRIQAVHLHDNDGIADLHQPIGHGSIEWDSIWDALNDLTHIYRPILEYSEGVSLGLMLQHGAEVEKLLTKLKLPGRCF
ncbi:sugar phosphate isomerase/epimerase [Paenibacillus sp. KQZ6P-2]|uniref:Sugar phosphate isomerase/epimerase n=1 Tax=Paenibacillus mangrovi TaxID=2931978 RepID=A0A9X1WQC1_9BACL|nr:sugar phosphate isomerase/epimerase [Paenibacillus mangrovi]MCJ8013447.1 sugar phosphate isomerase/epimerase [Paenibacillus mangrovi]